MKSREQELEQIIVDIIWMARRYANGRMTYAPSMVNDAIDKAISLGLLIEPDTVDGIEMYANRPTQKPAAHLTDKLKECPVCHGHGDYHYTSCKRDDI